MEEDVENIYTSDSEFSGIERFLAAKKQYIYVTVLLTDIAKYTWIGTGIPQEGMQDQLTPTETKPEVTVIDDLSNSCDNADGDNSEDSLSN